MVHDVLISVHSVAGVAAFVSGMCIVWNPLRRQRWFRLYASALGLLVVAMVAVIFVDWPWLNGPTRATYGGLSALGAYMLLRAWRALRAYQAQRVDWMDAYIGHVGFTLISLLVGFLIVGAIDLYVPGWLVGVVAVGGVAGGIVGIEKLKTHAPGASPRRPRQGR